MQAYLKSMSYAATKEEVDAAFEAFEKVKSARSASGILLNAASRALRRAEERLPALIEYRDMAARHLSAVESLLTEIEAEYEALLNDK